MVHTFIGNLGHFLIISSFIASLISAYGYYKSVNSVDVVEKENWLKYGRNIFLIHGITAIGIVVVLFYIIHNHYFEYHYAYSHSSSILPVYYQISAFWEGQEGSFLLWIFWNVLLGFVLIKTNKFWEAPVMAIFGIVQAFLVSMILGVVFFNVKLGSSPFILLRDAMDAPIFKMDPNFIPEDGSGLNPLLQNYWMVIHPPTLFLGFATTLIPFAYAIAGLWTGKFREWIRPALPWALFSGAVLGVGILMGAYWAYETLNFGGYWNWDPVENAVYVPWLILIAAIHTMIAFKKSTAALKSAIILAVSSFLLIVYSTFLTRSGILGDSSVHSFTDLGLSGQLLIYLLAFVLGTVIIIWRSWKHLGSDGQEVSTYSREFWIFMGATVLCLMGFQVIMMTSGPVFNAIFDKLGLDLNMAPPVNQVKFYTNWQIWGAMLIALLSGTGQFFWWNKMDQSKLRDELLGPVLITLVLSALAMILLGVKNFTYILLLTFGLYSVIANGKIFIRVIRKSGVKLSGGAVTHIGIALMLIGILFSSGYEKILSINHTGMVWSKQFPDEVNQKNLLLFLNEDRQMGDYSLKYRGMRKRVEGIPGKGFVDANELFQVTPTEAITLGPINIGDRTYFAEGDTVTLIMPETSFFEIDYTKSSGEAFTLFPTVQINQQMDMTVYSPDISRTAGFDMYTHIRTFPDPEADDEWSETQEIVVKMGEPFFLNDFVSSFENVERIYEVSGVKLDDQDVAIKAMIKVQGSEQEYFAEPLYIIKNNMAGRMPDEIHDLGLRISLLKIDPQNNEFTLGVNTTQKDWVILEAVEKPLINILWIGTLVMVLGFGIAITRRYADFVKMKEKGIE